MAMSSSAGDGSGAAQPAAPKPTTIPWLPAARTITIPPRDAHKATVVFLHGLGDTGAGWADVPGMLSLPHVKWVFPSAQMMPVSLNGGFPCPSWFDVYGLSEDSKEDAKGIDLAARHIAGILHNERKQAPEGCAIVLGGFSQGGALSLYLTTRKFLGTFQDGSDASSVPLNGTVCLSGWMPLSKLVGGQQVAAASESYPLLLCHGKEDRLVSFSFGDKSAALLRSVGFSQAKFKAYSGLAHSASPEELQDVKAWLQAVAAAEPASL